MGFVAAGVAAAGVAGSVISASGAESAASKQAGAAEQASNLAYQTYQQNAANLAPYNQTGQAALNQLASFPSQAQASNQTAYNNAQAQLPTMPTQATVTQLPGYQFQLNQGLTAIRNQMGANGQGIGGNALNAAVNYASGLASSNYAQDIANQQSIYNSYSNQYQNKLAGNNQTYNQLLGLTAQGENAAAQTGYQGNQAAATAGSALQAAGQAQAAGTVGAANALSGGVNSLAGAGALYGLSQNSSAGNFSSLPSGYSNVNGLGVPTPSADGSIPAGTPYFTQG